MLAPSRGGGSLCRSVFRVRTCILFAVLSSGFMGLRVNVLFRGGIIRLLGLIGLLCLLCLLLCLLRRRLLV